MFKIVVVIVGLLLLLLFNRSKKSTLAPSSFLILIYLVSAVACLLDIYINDETLILNDKYWFAAIVFLLLIISFLYPFVFVNETQWKVIKLPNQKILDSFSTIIIILSIFSMFYYVNDVITVFTSGDLAQMREHLTGMEGEYTKSGILNTIASVSASFYDIALLLFFIYSAIGGYKKRRIFLLLSSFSYTVQVLTYVGRDGVVYWTFSFIFYYLLLKDYLPDFAKKSIKRLFIKAFIVGSIPFIAISISRFGDSDSGTSGGLISYIGQPISHWCYYYSMEKPIRSPGANWPLYYEITGLKQPEGAGLWEAEGTNSWSFGTFLRSWHSSMGLGGILLACIFMWVVFILVFNKQKKKVSFHSFFIYILFFEIISQGVFYFRQCTRGGNLTILLMFALFFYFSFLEKKRGSILINKANQNLEIE
jgi:oligosaccharide repeat unit polymerase